MTNPFAPEIVAWAQVAQKIYHIPASLNLSVAKLESNLGVATPSGTNNWHGIKDASNPNAASTREQAADGTWYTIRAGFRRFASPADSFIYYGRLLGLAAPYHNMVTTFLRSKRLPADVQMLSHSLTGVYATAKSYGGLLVKIQQDYNLYQYDTPPAQTAPTKEPPVVDLPTPAVIVSTPATISVAAGAAAAVPVPVPNAPRVTPTVSQDVRIDWGSWMAQALAHETVIIEAAAQGAVDLALKSIPFGSLVSSFIGPTIIKQYVDMGLAALEGVLEPLSVTAPGYNVLFTTIANLINANEKALAAFLGDQLDPMIHAALAKIGIKA